MQLCRSKISADVENGADIALVIDAMDLLHSGRVTGFCLVSSDSDFTRLATRICEQVGRFWPWGGQNAQKLSEGVQKVLTS
jgi:uncharacterized LabA/DUF88 family protein